VMRHDVRKKGIKTHDITNIKPKYQKAKGMIGIQKQ